jgi:hypothetical protein
MATTYKSTIEINVWKEHSCIGCGSHFRYLFKRKKTGQGNSPEAASAAARQAVLSALQHEVDFHPCPGCGLFQPDMLGTRRWARHWWVTGIGWAALLLLLILALSDVMVTNTAVLAAAATCAVLGLIHLVIDINNPNSNLEANRQKAQQRVEKGDLWVPPNSKTQPEAEIPQFGWSVAHAVAYMIFGLGVLAFLSPEALRLMHGWPASPDWYPLVAGPGDDPYIYFPNKITSVKGYWRGTGQAFVENAAELGIPPTTLRTESKNSSWGDSINIGSRESKTSTNTLWLRVQLPNDPKLEGKTLKIRMQLTVLYPDLQGSSFEDVTRTFQHSAVLPLQGASAGSRYHSWWWGGVIGGVLLTTISSITLIRLSGKLNKMANPTNIFTPGEEEGEGEGAPAEQEGVQEALPVDPPHREDGDGITRRD